MLPLTIVGLDLSLTSTGVAEVYLKDGAEPEIKVTSYGSKGTNKDTLEQRRQRITLQATRIVNQVIDANPGMVLVEAPAFNSKNGNFHDRSGLWWLTVASIADRFSGVEGFRLVEVPPTVVKKFAVGKGNASKDEVLISMTRRYPTVEFKNNDESDALALAAIGAYAQERPIVELPKNQVCALDSIHWPEAPNG